MNVILPTHKWISLPATVPSPKTMRPIFCGNFEYETRQSDLERLFSKYGRVERVDMKSGFAFVYFEDERDAEDAICGLDNIPFGYDRRRLSVEWAKWFAYRNLVFKPDR
ncbi:UNVERIFIED_CONTAM: Serine/arginine-rich splicing factor RS31 [Sesamum calycinum]|uniref:Serine/arginine-rich splicing factor RS31 n=1 Tax=Sesamum calycinum TaxID=2727403 RepID=A0AAW2T0S1_9LAMI